MKVLRKAKNRLTKSKKTEAILCLSMITYDIFKILPTYFIYIVMSIVTYFY